MHEPLTPPDCDLRGLPFMPLDVVRLGDSDLAALSTGDEFKAAVLLWCKSWLQVPAASLPDDDRVLAHLTGLGPKWKKVREMALKGWVKCTDGRFYHPVIAEKAADAWERRGEWQEKQNNKTERQQRWREHVKATSAELRSLGATPPSNASLKELERLLVDARASTRPSTVGAPETAMTGTGTVEEKALPKPALSESIQPSEPVRATDCFNEVCASANWSPRSDTQRAEGLSVLAGWLALGCAPELILEAIARARRRNPSPTKSLKRFESTIRGMRSDQTGGNLPPTIHDVQTMTRGITERLRA